jgi:protein TonB
VSKARDKTVFSAGVIVSVVFHAVLIAVLLFMFHPQLRSLAVPKRLIPVIELVPPRPPPRPPEPPKPPPPKPQPPKPVPPKPVAAPILTQAPAPLAAPAVPPPPPPEPPAPAPPQPPAPTQIGYSVPTAYSDKLLSIIQQAIQYPPRSQANGEEGTCKVRVHISRDGRILGVELVEKSGYILLDKEARDVFSRIGSFPPVPEGTNPEDAEFIIELPISFTLSGE